VLLDPDPAGRMTQFIRPGTRLFSVTVMFDERWWSVGYAVTGHPRAAEQWARAGMVTHPGLRDRDDLAQIIETIVVDEASLGPGFVCTYPFPRPPGFGPREPG
jgi:hypothetical protein